MRNLLRSLFLLPALVAPACNAAVEAPVRSPGAAASASAQDQRMAWWRDARFGMFIHWGLYAIPAGEWRDRKDHGEWIRDTAHIPVATYEQFQPQWNPVKFDADAWAKMAADAGMKYLVITSKHHDGFCLFDSKQTDWDAMNTPFARDILKELSAACARHSVKFCTYHSIMDWHHPDYLPRRPWEAKERPAAGADFERFERYLHAQVTEVVQQYAPAVMWFDGEWENTWSHARGVRLFELCRRLAPTMVVNNRVDVHRGGMGGFNSSDEAVGDFATPEQEIPATGIPGVDWESCMTMNAHWGWNQADTRWKSTPDLLRNLIDIASKGGNYLLNIGPRADGTFPPQAVERLAQIGAWMQKNGEAIHGTTASVFDALPWGRCTVKRQGPTTKLYLHVFDWPRDGRFELPAFANEPKGVPYLLADPKQQFLWQIDNTLAVQPRMIRVPATAPDPIATVVVVEIDGEPIVYRMPVITAESDEFVTAVTATIGTASPGLEVRYTLDGSEPTADSPRAAAPVQITATCAVKARAFHGGKPVSNAAERRFTKVTPSPAVQPAPQGKGLRVERFQVDWDRIPADRQKLPGGTLGESPTVTAGAKPGERVALRFTGFLDAPQDELYRFALASDDGSRLWIDGQLVVDNDGLHGAVEVRGARALAQGLHPIEVVWFNKTGGAELSLRWAMPGGKFAEVPESALRH